MKIALTVAMLMATPVFGASIDYCKPYAAQTTEMMVKYLWLRAYSSCLNADEEPQVSPATQESLIKLIPAEPKIPGPPPGSVAATEFDPEWVAQCKKEYHTFSEKDGTVIRRGGRGKRVKCPISIPN